MKKWEMVREDIENRVLPAIHQLMSDGDPMLYLRYKGRCCKQTAYLLACYLQESLPDYNWSAWKSMFEEEFENEYAHAWVYGESIHGENHLILDYGKLKEEYAFFMQCKGNQYPEVLRYHDNRFIKDKTFFDEEDVMELGCEIETNRIQIVTPEDSLNMAFVNCSFNEAYKKLQNKLL